MLKLSERVYEAMRLHGEETYPHECCGILLGKASGNGHVGVNEVKGGQVSVNEASVNGVTVNEVRVNEVVEALRAGNTRTDSAHNRYNIAPQELVRAQRQGRERGLDIIGFYHSHPDHPAQWSPTDFAEAHWLGCSYVITAVERGRAQVTNSFLLAGTGEEDKRFEDESIEVVPGSYNPDTSTKEKIAESIPFARIAGSPT